MRAAIQEPCSLPHNRRLTASRCKSGTFSGSVTDSFYNGYWILLAQLSAGAHTIHFTANVNAIPSLDAPSTAEDITYNLTVE